jgi:hypothetical protein
MYTRLLSERPVARSRLSLAACARLPCPRSRPRVALARLFRAQDEWICFWELCRTVNEECSDYTDDGAWPILLDEYVDYVKEGAK